MWVKFDMEPDVKSFCCLWALNHFLCFDILCSVLGIHLQEQLLPTSAFFFCLEHLFFLQDNILFFGLFSHCSQLVTHLVFLLETLYTLITPSFDKYFRVWLVLACWHSHKSLLVWFVPLLSIRCFRKSIMLHTLDSQLSWSSERPEDIGSISQAKFPSRCFRKRKQGQK